MIFQENGVARKIAKESLSIKDLSSFISSKKQNKTTKTKTKDTDLLNIEKEMGRVRVEKWGERIIDIDILFYNNEIIETNSLCIPHPYISKRRFVLTPLQEIEENYVHPILQKTINELLLECLDEEKVSIYEV